MALLLCQAKGEHSRLVPQDLCPREVLIDEMKLIKTFITVLGRDFFPLKNFLNEKAL